MTNQLELLDWDSKFFGYKVGRIDAKRISAGRLEQLFNGARKARFKLIYLFVNPQNKRLNESVRELGGILVDEKVTFYRTIPQSFRNLKRDRNITSCFGKKPSPKLFLLSKSAGAYSRFRLDPRLRKREFEIIYREWLKNSLNGRLAKEVLVYGKEGKEVGFITLGIKNKRADIGLIAVDKKFSGKGMGRSLVESVFKKALFLGFEDIQVITQKANVGAFKFYEKLGFVVESVTNIYHLWLK